MSADRPRILMVVNVTWFFVSHRLPIAVAARQRGFDLHVAAAPDETTAAVEAAGVPFHPLPLQRGHAGLATDLGTLRALTALYRDLRPALVHHVTLKPVLLGSIAAGRAGVPRVLNAVTGMGSMFLAAGFASRLRAAAVRRVLRGTAGGSGRWFLFQNRHDLDEFVRFGVAARQRSALIAGSGVDLDAFVPVPEPPGRPLVVLPARMLGDKGVGEFVEAARRLRAWGVPARFALVGGLDPHNPSAVAGAALERWVAEGVVEWWGHRSDMPRVFAEAALVCLPSYREGMPKALLEACAAGRPIVATDVPGCADCVEPGVNGLLVPARDATALTEALAALLADPARRAAMGAAGRRRAERDFGLAHVVDATLALYARCLA